jgi:hypothetical protein
MAKIFSTEKLALNGDSVRIESSENGAFEITDGSNVLISRATIESDVSSLNYQDSVNQTAVADDIDSLSTLHAGNVTALDADVVSLNTQDADNKTAVADDIDSLSTLHAGNVTALDADVSSLNYQDSVNQTAVADDIDSLSTLHAGNVTALDADVSSLNYQDSVNQTAVADDIDSLAVLVNTNDVYAVQEDVSENSISVTIDYSTVGFTTAPAVVGSLTSYVADDPIIGVQLSGTPSTTGAVFMFSDEIPSTGYKIDVLASV